MFYPLSASTWGHEEIAAAKRVLDSTMTTMGEECKAFEKEFAAYHNMRYGIAVNSGSSANLIATAALFYKKNNPLKRGDEVIVPALSWATTYHPLLQHGLKLNFVDIDLATLNVDPTQLKKALTPNTRAIVAVSILGNPAHLTFMRKFADENNLYLIEDNCESMDAEINGQKCGTFGHLNTFSFFFSHHISTMEGGMILTDDVELAHLCVSLRAHGWTRDLPADSPLFEDLKQVEACYEAYRFILPGYNVRPLEIGAAIGRAQLKKLPAMTAQRRDNWEVFKSLFSMDKRWLIQQEDVGKTSAFSFILVLAERYDRAKVFAALKEADIGHRIITGGSFLNHDVIKYYDYEVVGGSAPWADIAHRQGFFVGNYPTDLTPQLMRLRDVMDSVCK